MTNGDDQANPDDQESPASEDETAQSVSIFERRLEDASDALEDADTESDLDDIETDLSEIEADIAEVDLAEEPVEPLHTRISTLREQLEGERGPYPGDVIEAIEDDASLIEDTRWTDDGKPEVLEAVVQFCDATETHLGVEVPEDIGVASETLKEASAGVADLNLDPDEDSDVIGTLLAATLDLSADLASAESFEDLTVQEKFRTSGFYDIIDSKYHKDFPPELNAILTWEKRYKETRDPEDVEPILLALDLLESKFMEENILDSFERIAPPSAYEAVHDIAEGGHCQAVRVLGKIGDERAVETLLDFLDEDCACVLQQTSLRALGEIGSREATQQVANKLADETDTIRRGAARALGLIGDTRAIEPLGEVLAEDDDDSTRASAVWALNQIGTQQALETASEYTDDQSYLVQVEAENAIIV